MKTIKTYKPQSVSKIITGINLNDNSTWQEWHSFIENELKENRHLFNDNGKSLYSIYLINGNLYKIGSMEEISMCHRENIIFCHKIESIGLKRNEFTRCEWVKRQKFTEEQLLRIYELFNEQ